MQQIEATRDNLLNELTIADNTELIENLFNKYAAKLEAINLHLAREGERVFKVKNFIFSDYIEKIKQQYPGSWQETAKAELTNTEWRELFMLMGLTAIADKGKLKFDIKLPININLEAMSNIVLHGIGHG